MAVSSSTITVCTRALVQRGGSDMGVWAPVWDCFVDMVDSFRMIGFYELIDSAPRVGGQDDNLLFRSVVGGNAFVVRLVLG